jgi:hypothetical protein
VFDWIVFLIIEFHELLVKDLSSGFILLGHLSISIISLYELFHVPGFSGQKAGVIEQDPMAKINIIC